MTKRFAMWIPMAAVAVFGALASCGDKEATPADAMEEAGEHAEDAADHAEEAAEQAEEAADK